MVLATSALMAKPIFDARRPRTKVHWSGLLIAAGLTLALTAIAAVIASLVQQPAAVLLLTLVTFFAVGYITPRFRNEPNPLEPALGAALTMLVLSAVQLLAGPPAVEGATTAQILISVLFTVLLAFSLAWLGARLSIRNRRETMPLSRPSSFRREHYRGPPPSHPAPHSS